MLEETGPALCPCLGRCVPVMATKVRDAMIVGVVDAMKVGETELLGARVLEGKTSGVSKCGGTASTVKAAAVLTLAIASSIIL